MMSRKFLGSTAALALVAALSLPTASFAFRGGGGGGHFGGGGHWGGGGFGGARMGGGPAMGARMVGPSASFAAAGPRFTGAAPVTGARFAAGAPVNGAVWRGGAGPWHGGFHDGHRRFFPGAAFAAGAALGAYAAYGGPDYYYGPDYYADDTYYDNGYYDIGTEVAVVPVAPGGDASYCAQRYRSYDPASGTFLGYDGQRHPCP
jgi:hypothetical protein